MCRLIKYAGGIMSSWLLLAATQICGKWDYSSRHSLQNSIISSVLIVESVYIHVCMCVNVCMYSN